MIFIAKILAALVLLVCLGFIAYWAIAIIKGDCVLKMMKSKRTPIRVESMTMDSVTLSYTIPIKNVGKQLGTIMDAFVRTYLPFEQYDEATVTAHLTDFDVPRHDDYWQAFILEPGKVKKMLITLEIKSKSGSILRDLETFPEMAMDVIYQVVARSDYYYAKTRVVMTKEELRNALYEYKTEVR